MYSLNTWAIPETATNWQWRLTEWRGQCQFGTWVQQMDTMMQQSQAQIATRFSPTRRPEHNGRTPTLWMRERLSQAARSGEPTARERIYEHLLEVATSWEVRVIGKDRDGELLRVASGRDSVEAAKLLLGYDMGAVQRPESRLEIANHLLAVAKLQVDLALGMLGNRVNAMNLDELKAFFAKCSENPSAFLEAAQAMQIQDAAALPEPTPEPDKVAP